MEQQDFNSVLQAICLVFGGSYLNHSNAPCAAPDRREQSLVKLLCSYLNDVSSYDAYQSFGAALVESIRIELNAVSELLKVWAEDLDLIYQIRDGNGNHQSLMKQMIQRFLQRIKDFEDCTIIPSGLISALHNHTIMKRIEGRHDHVNLAILKKRNNLIDWVQVNPGSAYHQDCPSLAGDKTNAFFEIKSVNPNDITEDWLYILVGLKAIHPGSNLYYKEVSLYECLLVFLNGKTTFQPCSDEGFIWSSPISPTHTWQVVDQSFQYLLRHFLGDAYRAVYHRLLTGFKLFLMERTFAAYQRHQTQQCHFLLQEMCCQVAQQALDYGTEEQKSLCLKFIDKVKAAIEQHCSRQELQLRQKHQLGGAHVSSLRFVAPRLIKHTPSSNSPKSYNLTVEPVLVKPSLQDNIIDYLQQFKLSFVDKLICSNSLNEIVLLSYGIEVFFIDCLAKTNILETSEHSSFSGNDTLLASMLKGLAESYYSCQVRLVNGFLSNLTYQPQFFSKNVIVQFFVYAAVAALNFRDQLIGPLLSTHNLSVAISVSQSFDQIIPHLVIENKAWLKIALRLKAFFAPEKNKNYLFSYQKFEGSKFTFEIGNYAEENDVDVGFAYKLLQRDPEAHSRFDDDYCNLDDEKFNRKWQRLAYTDDYLPSIYGLLCKLAHFAKVSLRGFPSELGTNSTEAGWVFTNTTHYRRIMHSEFDFEDKEYWRSIVSFKINSREVCTNPCSQLLASYLLKNDKDRYQRLIIREENICKSHNHFLENEIIASQSEKPNTMDNFRYVHLGFLQSEPQLKLERLYIALQKQQLDFNSEEESVLIKQTLFEVSILMETGDACSSLLLWTVHLNPLLIRKLGSLCIEKARSMQYRLTQHHAIGNVLEVILALLTFYPSAHKDEFVDGIVAIYHFLKEVLAQPPSNLSNHTLLHLNAYLIISVQGKPQLLETETLTVLKAFLAIQNYKTKGVELDNNMLLRVYVASYTWCSWIENKLEENSSVLNNLLTDIIPQWDQASLWLKNKDGLLFTCNDYAVKPLLGGIYFQGQPVVGLPTTITEHPIFKEYFGQKSFTVIPGSREIDKQKVPCYLSVDKKERTRLTLIQNALLIEEFIDNDYQRYIPAQELLGHYNYPRLLHESPDSLEKFQHWLDSSWRILIKDKKRQIIYQWDLNRNFLFSLQHQGHVVPWEQLQGSAFKAWLERIELSTWIEIIAEPKSNNDIQIQSLHFPRLGLHFDFKQSKFYSRQIHGYVLVDQQCVNTLHGFLNYFVLEKKEPNSSHQVTKVIIPHRQVTLDDLFFSKTAVAQRSSVKSPTYFVYDYDPKTGLLKGNHTRAQLYLALLYYCSASLDDHDLSNCNAYHLARENLEICWKDQPYDEIELSIIDQFLSPAVMRDFHSNRIALYLKVMSLLSSSLRLGFLYTDEAAVRSKKKSGELLQKSGQYLSFLLSVYLKNKSVILARIRLSPEEEKDVFSLVFVFQAYCQLKFSKTSQVVLSSAAKKSYKDHYGQLFSKQALNDTSFVHLFKTYLAHFCFSYDTKKLNFLSGFEEILLDRFRLMNFIPLYNLAKSSIVTPLKYCYMLHHMVFRAKLNYPRFPAVLVMMLARALLLVAENPTRFPESPQWFGVSKCSVELPNRVLTSSKIFQAFPAFSWKRPGHYKYMEEDEKRKYDEATKQAELDYNLENAQIWSNLARYDLDSHGVPLHFPYSNYFFSLTYECYVSFRDKRKQDKVRELYRDAAYNDAMYQFFLNVLQQCDQLKYPSAMGWSIIPFTSNSITVTLKLEQSSLPVMETVCLEKWASPQQPLVVIDKFFNINPQPAQNPSFLFESQLEKPDNEYQGHFYEELKSSWLAYHSETSVSYSWLSAQTMSELEQELQTKYEQIREQAKQIWGEVEPLLKERPSTKLDNYFALRWHSGQVTHYHKGDVLRLLVEPQKLGSLNPNCVSKQDAIIQSLLHYVNCEINSAKTVRLLALIEQCKQTESKEEEFSVLQNLVKSLQENLDPASYRYPHWFLFQLENDIIVRENQRELIEAMLNQTEKAMYQLNMGEGKSSVILPLLSNNLANGQQILRINVLSALLVTMKNFLCQRFSGLIRKHVYTLPFHRDTDISPEHLTSIFQALQTCQRDQHILLVTPEHRLCLQLKVRELMLENQQQIGATNVFNWQTYRLRAPGKTEVYEDLTKSEMEQLLAKQDQSLRSCLSNEKYIDSYNNILKVPPRGQGRKEFARFKATINNPKFKEWSCVKAAYRELLYNSKLAHKDSTEKLALLHEINGLKAIDLLDESDEILRHGTELNYTMGDKHMFAGGELRWEIPQFFIKAVFCDPELRKVIEAGKPDGFTVLNVHYSPRGGVPFIQLLDKPYFEKSIKPLLIEKFLSDNLPIMKKYQVREDTPLVEDKMSSLKRYISGQLSLNTEKEIMNFLADKGQLKDKLLIAKGWLSHGILFHVFNAKYRVQYGLNVHIKGHITKPIAIPFMGKDAPSPCSEFSHPDIILGFTIISYLYEGLDQQQLKKAIMTLRSKFCPSVADGHFKEWTEASQAWIASQTDSSQPILLKSLNNLDLSDEQCLEKVHLYLSGNYLAILFYLNQFILLQEAMQYLYKISANAHSLVGYEAALGFSGTDDRKLTMPFQVKSLRSATQKGTNGKLLSVLTQERNSRYFSLQVEDTNTLLEQLCQYVALQPHCHALIDAGALVTGLSNHKTAAFLLNNLPARFLGVLYFSDEGNYLTVLTRDSKIIAFQDCYLDKQDLFAYLDDVHTRGTDIKLPLNCHAILTVSIGMEKDKLMQAAMRLRQLAQKQSVSLWGTQAVTLAIARDNSVDAATINSYEVIKWVTKNTTDRINTDLLPVSVRKINFQFLKKSEAWLKEAPTTLDCLVQYCQEREMFLLEDFYGLTPQYQDLADHLSRFLDERLKAFWKEIKEELESKQLHHSAFYKKVFDQSDMMIFKEQLDTIFNEIKRYLGMGYIHSSLDNDEEKEVEVEVEVIEEQEVLIKVEERDARVEQKWDVRLILQHDFITSAEEKNIIMPLRTIKHFIQMPVNLKNIVWHNDIYMTANFINSVKSTPAETFDNYLRPVDVMLVHRRLEDRARIVLLSGNEAAQIKATCYQELDDNNLLIHLYDINGPTQLPTNPSTQVSKQEKKLLTIIKLFAGECQYPLTQPTVKEHGNEVLRLAKRVGRLYPHYFTCFNTSVDDACSKKIYEILIEEEYLDFSGVMTKKLMNVLDQVKSGKLPTLQLVTEYPSHCEYVLKKLDQIYTKLVIQSSSSLKENHNTLRQWIGTRGRLKEYIGSDLESIFNLEYQLKYEP